MKRSLTAHAAGIMIVLGFWIVPVSATPPPQTLTMTFTGSTIIIGGTVGS